MSKRGSKRRARRKKAHPHRLVTNKPEETPPSREPGMETSSIPIIKVD